LADRSSEPIIDLCEQESIAFLPWAPMHDIDKLPPVLSAARAHGVSSRQIALAGLLARSSQILPIPGSGSPDHVEDNVAAAAVHLTNQEANALLELA